MNRRDALTVLTALAVVPRPAKAQPTRAARVGILSSQPPSVAAAAPHWKAFYSELQSRGWIEGRNIEIVGRYNAQGLPQNDVAFAKELVASQPDVIVAGNSRAVDAIRSATRRIPIVMTNVSHAVEAGYVTSLARPAGNITGVTNQMSDLMGKHLELLRVIQPDLTRIGVLWSPNNTGSALAYKDVQAVAQRLAITAVSMPVNATSDMPAALAGVQADRLQALHVHPTGQIGGAFQQVTAWALEHRVPTISGFSGFTRGGFLLSYGADFADIWRISATFVDRILRGAKPADLPVEQPTKFEMIVNLKTARAIGVTLPQSILLRADETIS
jgi:putative tryptophan/tyrosine transport system substrate-binding protein